MELVPDECYYSGMNSEKPQFDRILNLKLPVGQSAFLWGARNTGKSAFLKAAYPDSVHYDLLKSDVYLQFLKMPYTFREEVLALPDEKLSYPIIIDEIQKIPSLLDEIHWLIENTKAYFIMSGSSARKLKRGAANLLGGRAWRHHFYPLVYPEIPDFDLLQALNNGLIPAHYLSTYPERDITSYIINYLKEEVMEEGLTRNLPAFARFLDAVAYSHGGLINYTNIARDCAVDAKTVKEYFQILIDTLIGYNLEPLVNRDTRDVISATPKFYLFDVGVASHLANRKLVELKGSMAGDAFEHYILMELMAYRGINQYDYAINYWRTKSFLEVDFILNKNEIAVEVKISDRIDKTDIKGLLSFVERYQPKKAYVVCQVPRPRKIAVTNGTDIYIVPWKIFIKDLWSGKIIK